MFRNEWKRAILLGALLGSVAHGVTPGVFDVPASATARADARPVKGERYVDLDAFGAAAAKVMPATVTKTQPAVRELRWRLPRDHLYAPQNPTFRRPALPDDIHFLLVAGSGSLNYMLWVPPGQRAGHLAGATSLTSVPVVVGGRFYVPVSFLTSDLRCRLETKGASCPTGTGRVLIPVAIKTF